MTLLDYVQGDRHREHCDGALDPTRQWVGIVLSLTDPADYKGGTFQAAGHPPTRHPRGSVTFIPGHIRHRVELVSEGSRHVITAFARSR
jgi:predicted 2-oxoglutarate/Fe(II)-dependent dioxygenase YbiX